MSKFLVQTLAVMAAEMYRVWRDDCPEREIELRAVVDKEAGGDPLAFEMLRIKVRDELSRNPVPDFRGSWEFVDGVPRIYLEFAKWLSMYGSAGKGAAEAILRWGRAALDEYHQSGSIFALIIPFTLPSERVLRFVETQDPVVVLSTSTGGNTLQKAFRLWATVIWLEKVKPEYDHKKAHRRDVPALTALTVDGVEMALSARGKQPDRVGGEHHFNDRSGNLLLTVPLYEEGILEVVFRGVDKLSSLAGVRVLEFLIREGCRRAFVGEKKPDQLFIQGGWRELAKRCGITSHKGASDVREVVWAMARGVFRFGSGRQGNLLTINESSSTWKGHSSWLLLTINPFLLPDYVCSLPEGLKEKRRLVPWLPEPPLVGRSNEHGRQVIFQLLVVKEFIDNAKEFDVQGAITLTEEEVLMLGHRAGLPQDLAMKVWSGWLNAGRPFVGVGEDRYTLAIGLQEYADFIKELNRKAEFYKHGGKR